MKLRPHHMLDIVSHHGHGVNFVPHPYGHAVHTVARTMLSNVDMAVELVVGADEICRPCTHLQSDGLCADVLRQVDPHMSKQAYNDALDKRLLDSLGLASSRTTTLRKYLDVVARNLPCVAQLCAHPGEDPERRLTGLRNGLIKFGIIEK